MPRSIWTGSISFGLVNVPVRLHSATQSKDISFHQFEKGTGERIRQKRVAEESGHEVDYDDIVKGYEVKKGSFVIVTPEELESVEPGQSRTIDIEDFVQLDDVDPIHFEKTYYLEPEDSTGAKRAYALLRDAMADSGRIA
ncbi:MAG TPA: Ku protein, partial [Acidimicrobiales bacterium]